MTRLSLALLSGLTLLVLTACGGGDGSTLTPAQLDALTVDQAFDFGDSGIEPGGTTMDATHGRIWGLLLDSQRVSVPGVEVTLRRLSPPSRQNNSLVTTSNERGEYGFGSVPPGYYRVECQTQHYHLEVLANHWTQVVFGDVARE